MDTKIAKVILCLAALILGAFAAACQPYTIPEEVRRIPEEAPAPGENPSEGTESGGVQVYYFDKTNQRVVPEEFTLSVFLNQETFKDIFYFLRIRPTGEDLIPAIDPDTALRQANLKSNILQLDVSRSFYDSPDLVAARVALVNTFTGLEGIDYVQISVEGDELMYTGADGNTPVGTMERYANDLNQVRELDHEKLLEAGRIVERELYFRDIRGLYLLTEVRTIYLDDERPLAALLVDALAQGPLATKGLYPVLPGDVQVLDAETDGDAVTLYMSRSFINTQVLAAKPEQSDLSIRVASLVLTITALSDVASVKFYYEDEAGGYTDNPVEGIRFDKAMRAADFTERIGRRIVVYFAGDQSVGLVPEYRAVESNNREMENAVMEELMAGTLEGNTPVVPPLLKDLGISVSLSANSPVVTVDLPAGFDGASLDSTRQRMLIYSIVNSLTDPLNLPSVNQVQFTVGGRTVDTFGSVDISKPLERNASLIQ
mgnify:CR=1 FL=1